MKPEIIYYEFLDVSYLAVIKNGLVIDIACSDKDGQASMFSKEDDRLFSENDFLGFDDNSIEVQTKDLALYTHWPIHTKEFWDLLKNI